jgi:predicted NUDIX family NTP pyrophosphohydrolase
MPKRISSGILLFRILKNNIEVFLVHPGGPFFKNKDNGAWGIPKGEINSNEDYLSCALREVKEEIGLSIESKNLILLDSITQKGGKVVYAWAYEQNDDFKINTSGSIVEMQWPPVVGKKIRFPEIDEAKFFPVQVAKGKIKASQIPLIERLEEYLKENKRLK